MKVRRDISSIPRRSAEETWSAIVELVTGDGSVDQDQLMAANSVMASLITDEIFRENHLTMTGVGPRLIVYLLHGTNAMELGDDVDRLNWNPTAGDWSLFVPCEDEEFDWAKRILKERAPRISVIKLGDNVGNEENNEPVKSEGLTVNWQAVSK
tara:strand:- start:1135 stop:1596 length:462 start_codon:yes stop_codon:yes gene_type:complete